MNSRENFIGDDQMIRQENVASSQQAKQIALIKWLLVKANRDPEDYKEIFQPLPNILTSSKSFSSRLHPKIVNALQSAELYSATLANMYIDHHFYNPDHNRILQVLARKGVVLSDPQLTVSVLLKSDPINLNAHLSVIEAIIVLYAKEIATSDRIYAAIEKLNAPQRYSEDPNCTAVIRQKHVNDYEQLLLLWINESVSALNKRIKQELLELQKNETDRTDDYIKLSCKEVSDLSDGIALCALVSFYSPQSLPWRKIRIGKPINTADSVHNLNLFINACQICLPHPLFHMNPQDMLPHAINCMKPNVIALMADLFNSFEISPPRCVLPDDVRNVNALNANSDFQTAFPSNDQAANSRKSGQNGFPKRPLHAIQQIFAIPNLRNYAPVQNGSLPSESRTANSSPKTERKIRNSLPDTQTSSELFVVHKGRNIPTLSSMNPNAGLKERQYEPIAAGKPTNWNDNRKNQMSGCGRRSRRNSFSDDSQLTIENFGGSHENINLLGRNPDKEPAVHVVNSSSSSSNVIENNDGSRQLRSQVAAQENWSSAAITKVLCDESTENKIAKPYQINSQDAHPFDGRAVAGTLSTARSSNETNNEVLESCKVSSQMLDIRLKLEEKRRQMEMEKRRMELNVKKQRQKLNEAAFLQAVSKIENGNGSGSNNDGDGCDELVTGDGNDDSDTDDIDHDSITVMCEDISRVEQRWLRNNEIEMNGDLSPKLDGQMFSADNIDIEKCQKSISEMNSSIDAIQTEIELLNLKESEMRHANPILENRNADAEKSYPISFMLNQGPSQALSNQFAQRRVLMNHPNQSNDVLYSNSVEYAANDVCGNYLGDLPNKNFVEYNYGDEYGMRVQHGIAQHHSLISTMPYKGPSPAAANVRIPFNSPDMYAYHQQHLPLTVQHAQMLPNANGNDNNYRSMNISHSNASDNKENQILAHQMASEQFYLHKPSDNVSPFQFQSASSPNPTNLDYATANTTNTAAVAAAAAAAFNQRRTWDNRDDATKILPPQPIPPPRMYTSRYSSSNDQTPVTLTKTFTDNKLRAATNSPKFLDERYNSPRSDHSPGYFATYTSSAKKSYSSMHDDSISNANHDLYNLSETDSAPRHSSVGCMSIPSPSVDDMAPQCISFIGTSDESNVADDYVDKYTRDGQLNENVNKLNIVNGSRTYRIPSPTNKAHLRTNSNHPFINDDSKKEKGFYVSFSNDDDNEVDNSKRFTERIKAPLRMKRALNSSASTISAKNEKYKANAVKTKFESGKKPETIYNDKDRSSDNMVEQRLHHNATEKIMEKASDDTIIIKTKKAGSSADSAAVGLLINADVNSNDPAIVDEMERKKERILLQSLQRRQQQEEMKARKEIETQRRKDKEKQKEEKKAQKKEEEKRRRALILEKHRLKKMIEEAEREGKPLDRELLNAAMAANAKSGGVNGDSRNTNPLPKLRSKKPQYNARPRPKTIHIDMGSNMKESSRDTHHALTPTLTKKGSTVNLTEHNNSYGMSRRDYYRGSQDCLLAGADAGTTAGTSASSIYSDMTDEDRAVSAIYPVKNNNCGSIGRRRGSSYKTSRDVSLDRATSRIARPKFSSYYQSYPRKSSSLMNLCGSSCDQDSFTYNSRYMTDTDCGLGLVTPPHRTSSPAPNNSSPSGPGSLPPSHHSRRLRYDDTASESGGSEYSGLRLYKQPTVKSNRGIITNAIEYCVFPGEVNRAKKNRLLEEINRSDGTSAKHFLILFRDAGCQYRALYSYFPESEEVIKVSGIGPRLVTEDMFDKFFKYNSGSKCFAQVHTKHLTVTIDAFTIHNNLWQGKKVNLPNKRDMTLVI